jgi:hypothetical protein
MRVASGSHTEWPYAPAIQQPSVGPTSRGAPAGRHTPLPWRSSPEASTANCFASLTPHPGSNNHPANSPSPHRPNPAANCGPAEDSAHAVDPAARLHFDSCRVELDFLPILLVSWLLKRSAAQVSPLLLLILFPGAGWFGSALWLCPSLACGFDSPRIYWCARRIS